MSYGSPSSRVAEGSPARHLSLGQLHGELARLEELARELRGEIAARWRLETKGKGRRSQKLKVPDSEVEEQTLQVLAAAQDREDLEKILSDQHQQVQGAKELQKRLQEELERAESDAQELSLGLPELLEARCREVKRQLARSDTLRQDVSGREVIASELRLRVNDLQEEVKDLQGKTTSMHQKHSQSRKLALEAESEAQELQLQCLQVKQGTELQTTSLGQRLEIVERLREEIPQWQAQVASLETLLTQRKEKLHLQLEAQHLATHLEIQTLRRRLKLHSDKVQTKQEEMSWLKRLAEALEQDVVKRHQQGPPNQVQ